MGGKITRVEAHSGAKRESELGGRCGRYFDDIAGLLGQIY